MDRIMFTSVSAVDGVLVLYLHIMAVLVSKTWFIVCRNQFDQGAMRFFLTNHLIGQPLTAHFCDS